MWRPSVVSCLDEKSLLPQKIRPFLTCQRNLHIFYKVTVVYPYDEIEVGKKGLLLENSDYMHNGNNRTQPVCSGFLNIQAMLIYNILSTQNIVFFAYYLVRPFIFYLVKKYSFIFSPRVCYVFYVLHRHRFIYRQFFTDFNQNL